jgi:MFS family permease
MEKSKLINLLILFLCAFFFWISITILLPTLPAYLQDIGATAQQIGFIMGCFAIGLLCSRIFLGNLADEGLSQFLRDSSLNKGITNFLIKWAESIIGQLIHYPSRKIVILIGTLVAGIAPLGYLVFNSIPELILVRAFHGISIAAFTTGYSALVVDLSPPKQKGELIGYMSLAIPMGMAIGPMFGGFLQESVSYQVLFLVCTSCGLTAFVLASCLRELESTQVKYSNPHTTSHLSENFSVSRSFGELITHPSFAVPAIILLLIGCLFGVLGTFLPLYIRELKVDFNTGLFYTVAAIASFIVRLLSGKASDKYGRGLFISSSILCYMISMILLSIAQSNNVLLLSAVIEGIGAGVLVPITLALISDRCLAQERGKAFAVCITGFDVGVAVGGPVFGSLVLHLGYRFLFAITAMMAMTALIIFAIFSNKDIINSWRFSVGNAPDLHAVKDK